MLQPEQPQPEQSLGERITAIKDEYIWPIVSGVAGLRPAHAIIVGRKAHIQPGEHVLEIGAGYPLYLLYATKVGSEGHFYAGDISENITRRAQRIIDAYNAGKSPEKRANVTAQQMDATHLPFEDEQMDLVIASNLTSEPGMGERFAYIDEAFRVLEPGGRFVASFTEPYVPVISQRQKIACERAGFTNIRVEPGLITPLGWNWFVLADKPM